MHLPTLHIDCDESASQIFLPYQLRWILDDSPLRLAEKSVRIGWTFCDAFKNVRKRLLHARRDYLFSSKDQTTAIEYVSTCYQFCEVYNHTRSVLSHGIENWKIPVYRDGKNTGFTEDFKVGYIKFDNGSRILSFSSNPHALRAYGGDVGLDEFAFHADAETLWASASGRITWGFDLAIWSSHFGRDTLFYNFTREAAKGRGGWSYYKVSLMDAIDCGLVEKVNEVRGSSLTRDQFIQNCKTRSRLPEVFEQEYMCNPCGGTSGIVNWSVLDRCRVDYEIERVHLEQNHVVDLFGEYRVQFQYDRESRIRSFILQSFKNLLTENNSDQYRLGFDVAASGRGNLTVIYIDRLIGNTFQLAALFTCRTDDWHLIKYVLFTFMRNLRSVQGCGDETGLGRQICWEASQQFGSAFQGINFGSEKSDIGFLLMNQLAVGEKQIPRDPAHDDIASDFLALRMHNAGNRWIFTESPNPFNPASHCDIAWAAGLASKAQRVHRDVGAAVVYDTPNPGNTVSTYDALQTILGRR